MRFNKYFFLHYPCYFLTAVAGKPTDIYVGNIFFIDFYEGNIFFIDFYEENIFFIDIYEENIFFIVWKTILIF